LKVGRAREARVAPGELGARDREPVWNGASVDGAVEGLVAPAPVERAVELGLLDRAPHLTADRDAAGNVESGLLQQVTEELPRPIVCLEGSLELVALERACELGPPGIGFGDERLEANRVRDGGGVSG